MTEFRLTTSCCFCDKPINPDEDFGVKKNGQPGHISCSKELVIKTIEDYHAATEILFREIDRMLESLTDFITVYQKCGIEIDLES